MHNHAPTDDLEFPVNLAHIFGLWEETGANGENPLRHSCALQKKKKCENHLDSLSFIRKPFSIFSGGGFLGASLSKY